MLPHRPATPPLSRRNFLALSGAAGAALLGSAKFPAGAADGPAAAPSAARSIPIGLELYSVRTELGRDLPNTLRQVAKMGYEVVEFYSPYASWTVPYCKEVRGMMDDLGLRCYSTHNAFASLAIGSALTKTIELNQILGVHHIVLASAPNPGKSVDGWVRLAGQLSSVVEQLKPHGLTAGYHNHQSEWAALDNGQRIMDVLAANTPKEFVLQLDVGTAVQVGADPVAWVRANPGRIRSMHLKDWAPGAEAQEKSYRVLFGEGVTPWKDLIAAAESVGGVEHYLLEQEGSRFSEFETAQRCLANWKSFRAKG